MEQQSSSDFSIVKDYIEIKKRYEFDVKNSSAKLEEMEEKYKKRIATLEQEIVKRNEQLKTVEAQANEAVQKLKENETQMKTMGLELHRLRQAVK
jgi:multidrug resistance efflux pump